MTYEMTDHDKECLGYEIKRGIPEVGASFYELREEFFCGWSYQEIVCSEELKACALREGKQRVHLTEESAMLAAWTLNKVAALNRCARGKMAPFSRFTMSYYFDFDVKGLVFSVYKCRYDEHFTIIKPFYTEEAILAAIAEVGGVEVMKKVIGTLRGMF